MSINFEKLIDLAITARNRAYAPYSDFKVGAALMTKCGKIFLGCNVENISYGATNCAERTAVFKAVSEGYKDFALIAITSSGEEITLPCGICLQVLAEFSNDLKIITCQNDTDKTPIVYELKELLPLGFSF